MDQKIYKQLKSIAELLKKRYRAERIMLYGSYARDEADEDSDVDMLVIAPTDESFFQRTASAKRLTRELRDGLPLSFIVLTPQEIEERKNKGDQFINDILETGIEL
ncbi:MAG: nucleotidyltransferase domain-containing protein [Chloroflexota bacterium]